VSRVPFQSTFTIGRRHIGGGAPAFVIAEAGSNHNGDEQTAHALIECAARCGADAVKFQTFTADALVARTNHPIATLTDAFGRFGSTVHAMFEKLEMPAEWLPRLRDRAESLDLVFLSTPFDEASADLLDGLGLTAFKIASYELVHLPLLRHVARIGKPILLSTGMATLEEIEEAVGVIAAEGNDRVALLHCPIGYPVPPDEVNLAVIDTLRARFAVPIGFSDHTLGSAIPVAAVARGASIVEKHFTLDTAQAGPDHGFAADPATLAAMIDGIRTVNRAIGSGEKRLQPSEELHYQRGRRSLFAATDIPAGTLIRPEMIAVLRPGVGLPPRDFDAIVGRVARRPLVAFQPISWDDV
jgi:sialic acid synthase SpsE